MSERVPERVLQAQRSADLRRHNAAAVYAELFGLLSDDHPQAIKIRDTAKHMSIEPRTFRRALALLERLSWIRFTHRDSRGMRHYVRTANGGRCGPPLTR